MHPTDARPHVVIVGGGIAGLAAAFFLRDEPVRVTVLEGSPRPGGKLCVSEIAGVAVDEGAEALLVTRPEGTGLIAELGLGGERVDPGTTSSAIWTLGALHPLPRRQFMGVPSDMAELAKSGVLSGDGVARASQDLELPPTARDGDVAVARYVGARLGAEVVDRLVDPLLGGVYAGRSAELSFDATLPALATASRKYRSLAEAARSLLPPPARPLDLMTRTAGPHRADRCSPRWPADWARCPSFWRRHRAPTCAPARWPASCPLPRVAGGSRWDRGRLPSRSTPTR